MRTFLFDWFKQSRRIFNLSHAKLEGRKKVFNCPSTNFPPKWSSRNNPLLLILDLYIHFSILSISVSLSIPQFRSFFMIPYRNRVYALHVGYISIRDLWNGFVHWSREVSQISGLVSWRRASHTDCMVEILKSWGMPLVE